MSSQQAYKPSGNRWKEEKVVMRVLILSCDTGGGHNACGEALRESFEDLAVPCQIENALAFLSDFIAHMTDLAFTLMYRRFPGVFRFGYRFAEQHPDLFAPGSIFRRFLSTGHEALYDFLRENQFQVVLCTHVFSALMMTDVLRAHGRFVKTGFVATDYTCSPGCAQSDLDIYFIPHNSLADAFIREGIPAEKLAVSGIPVRREFYAANEANDKNALKSRMQIGICERHAVMMCGSMGCGPIKQIVRELSALLPENCCLTVICGTNQKLREKLEEMFAGDQRIMVRGLVRHVAMWMDSADLFITKPGGISTTEAACKRLPMLFINAVDGCEAYNLRFFLRRGVASTASTPKELARQAVRLLTSSERLRQMASRYEDAEVIPAARAITQYIVQEYGGSRG